MEAVPTIVNGYSAVPEYDSNPYIRAKFVIPKIIAPKEHKNVWDVPKIARTAITPGDQRGRHELMGRITY